MCVFHLCPLQEESGELGNKMEEEHSRWRRVLCSLWHHAESERSAWRPSAADSSCIFQPREDGGSGGGDSGDGKWSGQ